MNFFGIGNMELAFILIIAVLVLGPARMVDVARNLGHFWGEAQRTLRAAADAATVKLDEPLGAEDEERSGEEPGDTCADAAASPAREPVPEAGTDAPEGTVARGTGEEPETPDAR